MNEYLNIHHNDIIQNRVLLGISFHTQITR